MRRLDPRALAEAPAAIRRPSYDRERTRIGLGHVGVGAFHRCHQAEYAEDALEAGADTRALVGVNLRPPAIGEQLGPQDGLYVRTLLDGEAAEIRVVGAIRRVFDAPADPARAVAALADSAVDAITVTVTEKGYCHVPATGALDEAHPDIRADLARRSGRRSLPGFLCDVLAARRALGAPVTLVSCDNIPANGRILRAVVSGFAEASDPGLTRWIGDHVRFPSTMVDRIVPATAPADLARVERLAGFRDEGAVVGEPFRQWVVEDGFNTPRPRWDVGGAEFVGDVEPYEFVKMRVLNACQSALSWLGALRGLETTGDDVRDPLLSRFVREMVGRETAAVLPRLAGMEPEPYLDLTLRRLANPAIRHRNHQIATDSSQKINQRILQPIRDRASRGLASPLLETAVAAWLSYLARSQDAFGARWQAEDPVMPLVARHAGESGGDAERFARLVLATRPVFGDALAADSGFHDRIAVRCAGLLRDGAESVLSRELGPVAGERPIG